VLRLWSKRRAENLSLATTPRATSGDCHAHGELVTITPIRFSRLLWLRMKEGFYI